MSDTIFHINDAGQLRELSEAPQLSEARFQHLLADHPELLAGRQLDPDNPRRWLFVDREVGVPDREEVGNRWAIDHLFIDQDGVPTLVEVKRATDTRIRRKVIGQILDYAANAAVYWNIEGIISAFERSCYQRGKEPDRELDVFLGADAGAVVSEEQTQQGREHFWETVSTNLRAGRLRLLIVADEIPPELQRIIEFLNGQLETADILGVAIKQYRSGDMKTLVPRVVGLTSAGENKKARRSGGRSRKKPRWTVDAFLDALDREHPNTSRPARRILEHFARQGFKLTGGTGKTPSIIPETNDPILVYPFSISAKNSVEVYFQWYLSRPPFDELKYRLELMEKLNAIPGVSIEEDRLEKRPSFPLELLADEWSLQHFLDTFDWFMEEIRVMHQYLTR